MKKILFLILLMFFTSACSIYHVTSEDVNSDYHPQKKSPIDIVYLETMDQPFDIIGYVHVTAERRQAVADVIERMKYEAATIGGDAITDLKTDATGIWKKLPAQKFIGNGYIRANFTATVVIFKQPAP